MGKYHTYTYFRSHKDIDEKYVNFIKKAFVQINENMAFVTNYFDIKGQKNKRDGVSLTKKLSGQKKIEFKIKDTDKYLAHTSFDNVTFAYKYLSAICNSYNESNSDTEKESIITELSGTIIHEATHAALGNEKYAYLIDYYYRHQYGKMKAWLGDDYVASNIPRSWLAQDYKNEEDVKSQVTWLTAKYFKQDLPDLPDGITIPFNIIYGKWYLRKRG